MSIRIYHVTAPAIRNRRPILFELPIEAVSEAEALSKAERIAKRRRVRFVFVPAAHRCGTLERELDEWVRALFDSLRADAQNEKKEKGTR